MATKTVAKLLVETLVLAGVKRIFGVAGDSLNGITDTIRTRKDITWIPMRHEEVGAFAAGAEAHLTGTLAVCAGSCGPGNLHLINGLYDCQRNRVPVIAIQTAISKRGVSVIVLPGDVSLKDAVVESPRVRFHEPKSNVCPSDEEL